MGLVQTVRFIAGHPLNRRHKLRALGRFVRWQVGTRVWGGPREVPFAGNTKLLARRGMAGATGNIYCGLHEFEDMALVVHALREGDTFLDVGANIGSYTVLAAGVAGASAVAFEPVPATFAHLEDNVRLNALGGRVRAHNTAVGRERGMLRFTTSHDTINHVASASEAGEAGAGADTIAVPVVPLDEVAADSSPAVIKIDVEGFETEVIAGAGRTLQSDALMAVLMELNGSGARYGYDESAIHRKMLELGFTPCQYSPFDREFRTLEGVNGSEGNTLYVRDVARLQERVTSAPPFAVLGTRL
jgi:FkbM family methyltransferase